MDIEDLAEQLRDLHIEMFIEHVMEMDDEEIIEHFITCEECEKHLVDDKQLDRIINESEDAHEFLDTCWETHEKNYDAYKYN